MVVAGLEREVSVESYRTGGARVARPPIIRILFDG